MRARAASSPPRTAGRTHAVGDERSCARRSDETVRVDVVTTLELRAGERFLRVHASSTTSVPRPPAARALPAAPPGRRLRRRVRVRGRAPRAHRRRRRARVRRCRRSCRAASSTRRDGDAGSRSCTTACSSTRSSTTAASSRSRCCARPATCRAPSRRCARTRPGRSTRSRARSSRAAARRVRGAPPPRRLAGRARCRAAADELPRAARAGARWRLAGRRRRADRSGAPAVDGAEVSARAARRRRAGSSCGWSTRRRAPTDGRAGEPDGAPLAGDVVDLTGEPLGRVHRVGAVAPVAAPDHPRHRRADHHARLRDRARAAPRPAARVVDHVGSSPGAVRRDAVGHLPQQRGTVAVPPHRERHRTASGRRVAHVDRLTRSTRAATRRAARSPSSVVAHQHRAQRAEQRGVGPRRPGAHLGPRRRRRRRCAGASRGARDR